MAKLDVRMLTRAADDLLKTLENPLHRQIIENYRRHSLLEVTGQWELIFAPDMTVEHPVYYLDVDGDSVTLDGYEQVSGFYKQLTASDATVIVLQDEQLAVADWGFASEAIFNTYIDGHALPGGVDGKFYVVRRRVAMHWPYDRRGRLIGEHVYEHAAQTETVEIPESEFITFDEARKKLIPLIRPLPPFGNSAT